MTDLFTDHPYGGHAGYRRTDTSKDAARSVDTKALHAKVLKVLREFGPCTPDEAAKLLGLDRLAIRPRFTELKDMLLIRDTGERRKNESKRSAIVWEAI